MSVTEDQLVEEVTSRLAASQYAASANNAQAVFAGSNLAELRQKVSRALPGFKRILDTIGPLEPSQVPEIASLFVTFLIDLDKHIFGTGTLAPVG